MSNEASVQENNPRKRITKEKIIISAKELFIENAVENVNMHQIAQRANIGQATLYRNYTKLSDICTDIVREECGVLIDEAREYLNNADENQAALEKLYQVIVYFISYIEMRVDWVCTVTRASTNYRPIQSPLYQWMRKTITELLTEADRKKEIRALDIPFTVEAILGTLNNIDDQLLYQEYTSVRILKGIKDLYIDGLAAKGYEVKE